MQLSIYILNKNLPNNYYINIYCPCIIIHNSSLDVSQSKHEVKGSNFEKNNKCSKFFGLKKFFVKDLEIEIWRKMRWVDEHCHVGSLHVRRAGRKGSQRVPRVREPLILQATTDSPISPATGNTHPHHHLP